MKINEKVSKRIRAVILVLLCGVMVFGASISSDASNAKLNSFQQSNADRIAAVVSAHWEEYGCLPSVAVAQAMQESSLGEHCSGNNLWGIASGAEKYDSLEDGAIRYMEVINNGCYKGAPFQTDWRIQIRKILDGNYCVPEGKYESYVHTIITKYNLEKYDDEMFAEIERRKEEERLKKEEAAKKKRVKKQTTKEFTFVYDPEKKVLENQLLTCESVIPSGVIALDYNNTFLGYFDVKPYKKKKGQSQYIIYTAYPELDGYKTKIEVIEDAVG